MERMDFLPIGSIVNIKGGVKKLMVIARGIVSEIAGERKFFDYGGCTYPEGLTGDRILYFNQNEVVKVVFRGFSDEDDRLIIDAIGEWMETLDVERGNPQDILLKNWTERGENYE